MEMNWQWFVGELREYPAGIHQLRPPCDNESLERLRCALGEPPSVVRGMLETFDGAKLFNRCGPMLTIFGVSAQIDRDPLEFAPDWYIDKYTPAWRSSIGSEGWVLGMMSYGGLVVLDNEVVREWDIVHHEWISDELTVRAWAERILHDGNECLAAE